MLLLLLVASIAFISTHVRAVQLICPRHTEVCHLQDWNVASDGYAILDQLNGTTGMLNLNQLLTPILDGPMLRRLAPFSNLTVYRSDLETLHLTTDCTLQSISLHRTELSSMIFEDNAHLHALDIALAPLAAVPSTLAKLENLKQLVISVTHIAELDLTVFYPLKELLHLEFTQNQLARLVGAPPDERVASKVKKILIRLNPLTTVDLNLLAPFGELEFLDLSSNRIKSLAGSLRAHQLKHISLVSNALRKLTLCPWDVLGSVEWLELSFNRLQQIPACLHKLPNVTELLFDHNRLTHLPLESFADLAQLRELHLTFNQIATISFGSPLPDRLRQLELFHNCLCDFPMPSNLSTLLVDGVHAHGAGNGSVKLDCSHC
ncbi:leucine-rich repeat and death domain-containing protein 1-like [Anopheles merus]|uniref:leucine-rich repeat and death domain-containing protein 1-like n=1 Tax=Anopheles merus TaxID=30066 RepID=UPI001BE43006|nr:leucine-rich repeat and death domain-containing protein 1-like [Anopheles merus]